mmetsp:Transcript_29495/g.74105  ORF Transcript_29495/g.74105 Transcript_29495/m.74105 type:complete len:209 (+) Transcript_29495:1314-1940(+)
MAFEKIMGELRGRHPKLDGQLIAFRVHEIGIPAPPLFHWVGSIPCALRVSSRPLNSRSEESSNLLPDLTFAEQPRSQNQQLFQRTRPLRLLPWKIMHLYPKGFRSGAEENNWMARLRLRGVEGGVVLGRVVGVGWAEGWGGADGLRGVHGKGGNFGAISDGAGSPAWEERELRSERGRGGGARSRGGARSGGRSAGARFGVEGLSEVR